MQVVQPLVNRPQAEGVGAILCYDPYFSRMLQSIRKIVADGHPMMVRLHPAAQYPAATDTAVRNDLEGHAVLIVGYDDDRGAVLIEDPWNRTMGGTRGGRTWMPYTDLSLLMVNSSKDCALVPAPLEVQVSADGTQLVLEVGLYAPDAIVMDHATHVVREAAVSVSIPSLSWTATAEANGAWRVGESARLTLELPATVSGTLEMTVDASAVVACDRPYEFADLIRARVTRAVAVQGLAAAAGE